MNSRFDTYAIYTMFKAASRSIDGGYVSNYLSRRQMETVDLERDFLHFYAFRKGLWSVICNRGYIAGKILWDLVCLMLVVTAIQSNFMTALDQI